MSSATRFIPTTPSVVCGYSGVYLATNDADLRNALNYRFEKETRGSSEISEWLRVFRSVSGGRGQWQTALAYSLR